MRLAIFSHCAVDTIRIHGRSYEQIGGPACYCGLTAREFGFDVDLFTKFGPGFPQQYLRDAGISLTDPESEKDTTRFDITIDGPERTLRLENLCEPLSYAPSKADGHILSPVFQEISPETLAEIKKDSGFMMLDPQGFLRGVDADNNVVLQDTDLDLSGVDALKVSPDEARRIGTGTGNDLLVSLQKKGAKYVLMTDRTDVSLLVGDKIYSIKLPNKKIRDTTGIGDIFCAAFCCTMLKEDDFLWALCFAGGAAQAALDSGDVGLQKVPRRGQIQTNASYFYNLVGFRDL